jgi:hypothetical protein
MPHVIFTCLCGVLLRGRHPGPGTPGSWTRVGALPHRTHQLSVQPGPGAMARSQDGYPGGSYSIGEAPSPSGASVMEDAAELDRSRVNGQRRMPSAGRYAESFYRGGFLPP